MNATNQDEQKTKLPKADFSHRQEQTHSETLPCAVEIMFVRAKSILSLISDLHIEAHINQIDGEQIHWAIDTVKRELDDIGAVINAYSQESVKEGV